MLRSIQLHWFVFLSIDSVYCNFKCQTIRDMISIGHSFVFDTRTRKITIRVRSPWTINSVGHTTAIQPRWWIVSWRYCQCRSFIRCLILSVKAGHAINEATVWLGRRLRDNLEWWPAWALPQRWISTRKNNTPSYSSLRRCTTANDSSRFFRILPRTPMNKSY